MRRLPIPLAALVALASLDGCSSTPEDSAIGDGDAASYDAGDVADAATDATSDRAAEGSDCTSSASCADAGAPDVATDGAGGDDGDASAALDAPPDSPAEAAPPIVCQGPQAGAYCGDDLVDHGAPDTLYQCPGAGQPPASAVPCANGCVIESQGTADHCAPSPSDGTYRLPWAPSVSMSLTQDCNDSCCNDHVGNAGAAWDFADGGSFQVRAARGGTIVHLKINSTNGCGTKACANDANFIVIDHGDGTQATYLHLQGGSLAANVSCGATVVRGQALAMSGTTGWSTGIHLHFQVGKVHAGAATCECDADGQGCATNTVPWSSFWATSTYPTVPIEFDEWPTASQCGDRRITMPASQNQ